MDIPTPNFEAQAAEFRSDHVEQAREVLKLIFKGDEGERINNAQIIIDRLQFVFDALQQNHYESLKANWEAQTVASDFMEQQRLHQIELNGETHGVVHAEFEESPFEEPPTIPETIGEGEWPPTPEGNSFKPDPVSDVQVNFYNPAVLDAASEKIKSWIQDDVTPGQHVANWVLDLVRAHRS